VVNQWDTAVNYARKIALHHCLQSCEISGVFIVATVSPAPSRAQQCTIFADFFCKTIDCSPGSGSRGSRPARLRSRDRYHSLLDEVRQPLAQLPQSPGIGRSCHIEWFQAPAGPKLPESRPRRRSSCATGAASASSGKGAAAARSLTASKPMGMGICQGAVWAGDTAGGGGAARRHGQPQAAARHHSTSLQSLV
jgi:hypothetical protein